MKYLIVYDITDDNIRDKVRRLLKDYGGERIQYSAFIIEKTEIEIIEILHHIRRILGNNKGKVIAIPLCKRDYEKMITIAYNYEIPEEDSLII